MQLNLKDKHVLITGATKGLGARIARAFADEGSKLSLLGRDKERLKLVIDDLGGHHGYVFHAADLMRENAPQCAVDHVVSKNGKVDIVIHNLGGSLGIDDPLAPISEWWKIWKLNIGIAIEINNLVVPSMIEAGWGRIVMISSVDSNLKLAAPPYGTAKAYLNSYVRHVAWRIAQYGIVLCGISPGPFLAEGNSWDSRVRTKSQWVDTFVVQHMPCGRLGSAEDIWPFVILMASDYAQWAVGSLIELDGGMI